MITASRTASSRHGLNAAMLHLANRLFAMCDAAANVALQVEQAMHAMLQTLTEIDAPSLVAVS